MLAMLLCLLLVLLLRVVSFFYFYACVLNVAQEEERTWKSWEAWREPFFLFLFRFNVFVCRALLELSPVLPPRGLLFFAYRMLNA